MLIEFVQLSIFNGYFLPPGTCTQSDLTMIALMRLILSKTRLELSPHKYRVSD